MQMTKLDFFLEWVFKLLGLFTSWQLDCLAQPPDKCCFVETSTCLEGTNNELARCKFFFFFLQITDRPRYSNLLEESNKTVTLNLFIALIYQSAAKS